MNLPDFTPAYRALHDEVTHLGEECAQVVEELSLLRNTVLPNLESEYMVKIGGKECDFFRLQVQTRQIRREISLYQAAINNGKRLTATAVEEIIEQEFADYWQQVSAQQKHLNAAQEYFNAPNLSAQTNAELKKLYHQLVRRLHPDINPDLPSSAQALWQRVVAAYHQNDLNELRLLEDMAEDALALHKGIPKQPSSLEHLQKRREALTAKIAEHRTTLDTLKQQTPYTYAELLNDAAQILARRKELDAQISQAQSQLAELENYRNQLKGA